MLDHHGTRAGGGGPNHIAKKPLRLSTLRADFQPHAAAGAAEGGAGGAAAARGGGGIVAACLEALQLDRAAQLERFWADLARVPPGARAADGRGCLVLSDLQVQ